MFGQILASGKAKYSSTPTVCVFVCKFLNNHEIGQFTIGN